MTTSNTYKDCSNVVFLFPMFGFPSRTMDLGFTKVIKEIQRNIDLNGFLQTLIDSHKALKIP